MNSISTIETCISDIEGDIPAIQQLISDISSGNVMNIISDVTTLIPLVEQAVSDCEGALIASYGKGLLRSADPATCYTDASNSAYDVYNIVEAVIAKNTTGAILDAINAVSDVTGAIGSCDGVNVADLAEYIYANVLNLAQQICVGDLISSLVDVDSLITDIKSGATVEQILNDVTNIVTALNTDYDACEPVIAQIIGEL